MKEKGSKFILYISALEFYLFGCTDLLNNKSEVKIKDLNGPLNAKHLEITSISDLTDALRTIFNLRSAAATKMNQAKEGHDGSSRSHAALILTLYQLNKGSYQKTRFHLIDLAGAERPSKTDS